MIQGNFAAVGRVRFSGIIQGRYSRRPNLVGTETDRNPRGGCRQGMEVEHGESRQWKEVGYVVLRGELQAERLPIVASLTWPVVLGERLIG